MCGAEYGAETDRLVTGAEIDRLVTGAAIECHQRISCIIVYSVDGRKTSLRRGGLKIIE